ncbi:MAG: glycosyltransferase family 2 protein [Candidatus Gastranaerophilaceae bacterium]
MLNLPLVSFVVTSYNYEKYILKTLESIKSQTYENFEIIIVDDKSSDNSVEVIKKFIDDNPNVNIKLIEHEYNFGQLKAFQTGLAAANGQFVSFIDSDDVITKDYAKAHIRVHLAASVAFTSSQIIEIGENNEIHTMYSVSSPQKETAYEAKDFGELMSIDVENVDFKILNTKSAPFGGWWWSPSSSAMFRKSAIDIILSYPSPQDWRICPDKFLFNLANLIGGSAVIYTPLVGYRRHNMNAGHSTYVCGNKRYNNDFTTELNIQNNMKIRPLTLKFIKNKKSEFETKFGKKNTAKLYLTVLLSYFYVFKQIFRF